MRRSVAILAFAALTSSQLVALRCDMGASAHHEAVGHEHAPGHQAAAHQTASPRGDHPAPHHADRDGCLMMMACGTASIRAVRTVAVARISTPFVRAASFAPAIPVAADLAVETPPPRLTV